MIYFEDLELGRERYFGSYEVTREEVLDFARNTIPSPSTSRLESPAIRRAPGVSERSYRRASSRDMAQYILSSKQYISIFLLPNRWEPKPVRAIVA